MISSNFYNIKERVSVEDILDVYGVEHRRGRALCPFHREKTPSFFINKSHKSWKCYGCGAGGTVLDFVMLADGLSLHQAARKICTIFKIAGGRESGDERRSRIARQKIRAERERERKAKTEQYFDAIAQWDRYDAKMKREGTANDNFWDALEKRMAAEEIIARYSE